MGSRVEAPSAEAQALWEAVGDIDGWLHPMEAWTLYQEVLHLDSHAPSVVEIGSWKGRSAVTLALAVKQRGAGHVAAIDPMQDPDRRAEYHSCLNRAGVADVVTTLE